MVGWHGWVRQAKQNSESQEIQIGCTFLLRDSQTSRLRQSAGGRVEANSFFVTLALARQQADSVSLTLS